MNERGRIQDVENDEYVDIAGRACQALALRRGLTTFLVA